MNDGAYFFAVLGDRIHSSYATALRAILNTEFLTSLYFLAYTQASS